ncbi:MAG: hypothetical protein AB7O96_06895 [Pseudobdellovibrionaceae bacterium]
MIRNIILVITLVFSFYSTSFAASTASKAVITNASKELDQFVNCEVQALGEALGRSYRNQSALQNLKKNGKLAAKEKATVKSLLSKTSTRVASLESKLVNGCP